MATTLRSHSPNNADEKAAFRKPSNDAAKRKYRRRSLDSGSSSADGSPNRDRGSSPISSRAESARISDHRRNGDSYRHSERHSSRTSHNHHRHNDYHRREKLVGEEERDYTKSLREHNRSREHFRDVDKYSREKSDGSGHRSSKGKERDTSSRELNYRDKDSSSNKAGSGRRNTNLNVEESKSGERDRHIGDKDIRDEKRDYRRSLGDYRSDRSPTHEKPREQRVDSTSRRDSSGYLLKDASKSGPKEEEKKKSDDREANRYKEGYNRDPVERFEEKTVLSSEKLESAAKKPKLLSLERVSKFSSVPDERQTLSSKQAEEFAGKVSSEQAHAKDSDAANDIDAAKVAAMKAAELVNKNLVGTGFLSTDQKKKLLWGSKKNTTVEESGHRWDAPLFSDRERQEKFNKLMSLSLQWYLWPTVGCEGRCESGAQTGRTKWRWPPPNGEAEGSPAGFGKAIHCGTPSKGWAYCWTRSLRIYLEYLCTVLTIQQHILLYCCVRYINILLLYFWLVRANCDLLLEFLDHDEKMC